MKFGLGRSRGRPGALRQGLGLSLVWASLIGTASFEALAHRSADSYAEQFGRVDMAQLPQVQKVFERVRAAADRRGAWWPELMVLESDPGGPALALPEGQVLLGLPALRSLYGGNLQGPERHRGDTRLAFMIGHELAHFANNDFQKLQHGGGVQSAPGFRSSSTSDTESRAVFDAELEADKRGFIYAALAGYPVRTLLAERAFLTDWIARYDRPGTRYAPAEERVARLQAELQELDLELQLYRFAVQFGQFGRCDDALPLLNHFRRRFPAREVLYNVGLCEFQLGLRAMPPAAAHRWWLPQVFDGASLLDPVDHEGMLVMRNRQFGPQVMHHLKRAQASFRLSAEKDDRYFPARLMLAAVHFLLEQPYQARAQIESALSLKPTHVDARGLRLLIQAQSGEIDNVQEQLRDLLMQQAGNRLLWQFNLAQSLEEQNNKVEANALWAALATESASLPDSIAALVCHHAACSSSKASPRIKAAAPESGLLKLGQDIYEHPPKLNASLRRMIAGVEVLLFKQEDEFALALDGIVELQRRQTRGVVEPWMNKARVARADGDANQDLLIHRSFALQRQGNQVTAVLWGLQ